MAESEHVEPYMRGQIDALALQLADAQGIIGIQDQQIRDLRVRVDTTLELYYTRSEKCEEMTTALSEERSYYKIEINALRATRSELNAAVLHWRRGARKAKQRAKELEKESDKATRRIARHGQAMRTLLDQIPQKLRGRHWYRRALKHAAPPKKRRL